MFSIVIPHWNNQSLLSECLDSLISNLKFSNFQNEIIIVDNGSTDGSREYLEQLKAKSYQLKAIFNNRNLGFAKAVNQGIEAASNDWVVVMNNDLKLDKNWFLEIKKGINICKNNDKIGSLFGKVLNWEGTKIESTGLIYWIKGKAFNRGNGEPADTDKYNAPEFIFGPSASVAAYYKPMIMEIGLFDEDFFAYEEDVDLALKMHAAGWKAFYQPTAISYHRGGETSKKMANFRQRMDAKNWWFIIIKNYPWLIIANHGPEILVERLRNLSGLIKNTTWYKIPISIIRTYGEIIVKLPKMVNKRQPISQKKLYEISQI